MILSSTEMRFEYKLSEYFSNNIDWDYILINPKLFSFAVAHNSFVVSLVSIFRYYDFNLFALVSFFAIQSKLCFFFWKIWFWNVVCLKGYLVFYPHSCSLWTQLTTDRHKRTKFVFVGLKSILPARTFFMRFLTIFVPYADAIASSWCVLNSNAFT